MIDFGLSKRYRCPKSGQHVKQKQRNSPTGTPRYLSLNASMAMEQSRRDDLESVGNIAIYFSKGGFLPWMADENERSSQQLLDIKINTTLEDLCDGLLPCFLEYMIYCRELKFEEKPNYKYLIGLFDNQFIDLEFKLDYEWCWHTHKKAVLDDKQKKEEEAKEQLEQQKASKNKAKPLGKRE